MNNGITILCDDARPHTPRKFSLDRPLIVNGLQTANMIWQHFASMKKLGDDRHILAKIIKSKDDNVRDQIIRATNRQTPINATQLRATEKLHRDVEAYFRTRNKYYERRKNQYKNAGKSKVDIFSINELAQAVMSIVLERPDDARARPSSLLRTDEGYNLVFRSSAPLEAYAVCAETVRTVERLLQRKTKSRKERNNLKFYIAFVLTRIMAGKTKLSLRDLKPMLGSPIERKTFELAYAFCRKRYDALGGDDDVARGSLLIRRLKKGLASLLRSNARLKVVKSAPRRQAAG